MVSWSGDAPTKAIDFGQKNNGQEERARFLFDNRFDGQMIGVVGVIESEDAAGIAY